MADDIFKDAKLAEVHGTWRLFYNGGREHLTLLDARSRQDAEGQLAEIAFLLRLKSLPADTSEQAAQIKPAATVLPDSVQGEYPSGE